MQLVRGVRFDAALRSLSEVRDQLEKAARGASGVEYLAWADMCETRLCAVFAEPDVAAQLHTQRYWYLYRFHEVEADDVWINTNLPLPDPVGQEIALQQGFLATLADCAERLRALAERPGRLLVYDTNALMHFQPPDKIDWARLVKTKAVRLVVPLVVVDELDRKQHEGSPAMSKHARSALRALDGILDGTEPGKAAVVPHRVGVTLEILMDEAAHQRLPSADDEIIRRAMLLAQITDSSAAVVTADTGMRLRAQAAGLGTLRLADGHRKEHPES